MEINTTTSELTWQSISDRSCYVAIPIFNQSRPRQRINSLHVVETEAVYRNLRFPSGKLPRMGPEKENLFAFEIIN